MLLFLWLNISLFYRAFFSNPNLFIADWGIKDWLSAYFGSRVNSFPFLYPLWFLRDLFLMNLFAKIFEKVIDIFGYYALIIFILLWLFVDSSHIFFLDIRAICFWGIGCFFAKKKRSLSCFDRINKYALFILYSCLIICVGMLLNSKTIAELVIYRLCITVGIIFWYVFTAEIKYGLKRLLLFISNYNFGIYLFHELNLTALKKILARILPQSTILQFVEYIGVPIVILLFCLMICIILEKITPNLYFVITGERGILYKVSE